MKKLIIFLLMLSLIYSVYAFSLNDLFPFNLKLTGSVIENRPPSVTLSRPSNTQVVNNPVLFKWRYFDPEDDKIDYYILQIDDDRRFYSPENYKGVGTEQKLILDEGLYYWRVNVVNKYGEKMSDIWEFYVDPDVKLCEDGTPYFECSLNKPFYCSAGVLREDCQRCGCRLSDSCQAGGRCLTLECVDGTRYSECSFKKPFFCVNGKLNEVCSICGCEEGLECMVNGECEEVVDIVEEQITVIEPQLTFLENVALFFKKLLGIN